MTKIGKKWDQHYAEHGNTYAMKGVSKPFFERLVRSRYVKPIAAYYGKRGGKVMEAGCGPGKLAVAFALMGYGVTAMDYNRQMLGNAENLRREAERLYGRKLRFKTLQDDLEKMRTKANSYDIVFNEGVVEHWLDKKARINVIRQMAKVTKRGGVVAITVPNGGHPMMPFWYAHGRSYRDAPPMTFYDVKKLRTEMEAAGLRGVVTDGMAVWRSVGQWPQWKALGKIGALLDRLMPTNRQIRQRFGVSIMAIGRKP